MLCLGAAANRSWTSVTNVCLLALQAYFILDELLLAGELQETSKKAVRAGLLWRCVRGQAWQGKSAWLAGRRLSAATAKAVALLLHRCG